MTSPGPVLGWVGLDNDGLSGLESALEGTLAGRPGEITVERDPTGSDLPGTERTELAAQRGTDLVLTIDQSIQYETERALVDQVNAVDAKGGMAIVMDVRTGDILAMANVDGETADSPAKPASSTEQNRTVTDVFEPGSTNKVVTIAAALEAGLVKPDTVIPTPSALLIDGTRFEDVELHPSEMTVADVLRESSNVGTITIARDLGKVRFDAAVRNFGFGRVTGLDFPGEAPGIILPLANYNDTSMASMPIGNGLAVTALQMLDVYVTLANNGIARQPRLLAATIGDDGTRHDLPLGTTRPVISPETAKMMRDMLTGVVESGTGVNAAGAGLHGGREDGHRPQAAVRPSAVPVRRVVRRVRAGGERPARDDRGHRRAGPAVLCEHRGRTGVLADHAAGPRGRAGHGNDEPGRYLDQPPVMEGPAQVLLLDLLDGITPLDLTGDPAVDVRSLVLDSRRVTVGACFACVPGARTDGHAYARQAVADGAVALLVERPLGLGVSEARVPNVRRVVGPLAARLAGEPSRALRCLAVTGTNGKTTTTYLLGAIAGAAGERVGLLGTTGVWVDGTPLAGADLDFTTPEATELQALLARLLDDGVRTVALEVSSHALAQHRVDGTYFAAACFTNLSHDHLDYHGDVETYFAAKASLFDPEWCAVGVINVDDPRGADLVAIARARGLDVRTYAVDDPGADFGAESVTLEVTGSRCTILDRRAGSASTCTSRSSVG